MGTGKKKHLSNISTISTFYNMNKTCNSGGEWEMEVAQHRQAAIRSASHSRRWSQSD